MIARRRFGFLKIAQAEACGSLHFRAPAESVVRWSLAVLFCCAAEVRAQSSSIYLGAIEKRRQVTEQAKGTNQSASAAAVDRAKPLNPELEKYSLFAVRTKPPNQFRVHDLITVIVREQKRYEGDSLLRNKKEFKIESKLSEFFRMLNGHLAAASFTDGQPNMNFEFDSETKGRGDTEREDKLTFRLTVEVIDIKPNGLLVLGGKQYIVVDEEVQDVNFTGTCRSRDVTADNTILSTQVFDQVINVQHRGALRDASKRGWLVRLFERFNPF